MARTELNRAVSVSTPLGDDVLLLERLEGSEELSRSFEFQLELASALHDLDFDQIVGHPCAVGLETAASGTRYFSGYVASFEQVPAPGELARYRARLVPWMWFLTRTSNCRIFQKLSVPEIVAQMFKQHGFTDFKLSLTGTYKAREYCVQYRESDFDFVSRLLEEEGIYYFYQHRADSHVLVMADNIGASEPIVGCEEIAYQPLGELHRLPQTIWEWSVERTVQPGRCLLRDRDYTTPRKALEVTAQFERGHARPEFEIYDYPGGYREHSDGETQARLRVEEFHAQYETMRGLTDARGLVPGALFMLTGATRLDQNREHLVTSARYELRSNAFASGAAGATDGQTFRMAITAIAACEQYRPRRVAPRPVIHGAQTATVVGPQGEEIWTDALGRIKVQFHWDRQGTLDENSSLWIRVAQQAAGKRFGAMFIPRIGQEVVVEFLEGNPDRPLVTGSVYNGDLPTPYKLPENASMTAFKTNTLKGGGNFNELRFDDKKDAEQVFLHAARNLDVRVKGCRNEHVAIDEHVTIEKNQRVEVKHDRHETIGGTAMLKIKGDNNVTVVGKDAKKVTESLSLQVGTNLITAAKCIFTEASQAMKLKASDVLVETVGSIEFKCGAASIKLSPGMIELSAPVVSVKGLGSATLESGGATAIRGATADVTAAMTTFNGATQTSGPAVFQTFVQTPSVIAQAYTPGVGNLL